MVTTGHGIAWQWGARDGGGQAKRGETRSARRPCNYYVALVYVVSGSSTLVDKHTCVAVTVIVCVHHVHSHIYYTCSIHVCICVHSMYVHYTVLGYSSPYIVTWSALALALALVGPGIASASGASPKAYSGTCICICICIGTAQGQSTAGSKTQKSCACACVQSIMEWLMGDGRHRGRQSQRDIALRRGDTGGARWLDVCGAPAVGTLLLLPRPRPRPLLLWLGSSAEPLPPCSVDPKPAHAPALPPPLD